jgi:hypothetical protein
LRQQKSTKNEYTVGSSLGINEKKLITAFAFAAAMFDSNYCGYIWAILQIQNEEMLQRIVTGQSRGVSPEIIIRRWTCSICNNDFERCDHGEGLIYDGSPCQVAPANVEFIAASLVDEPKDPKCRINDLLTIWQINKRNLFEWYGFELHNENIRFKDIDRAHELRFISQEAVFQLSKLFSVNLYGRARWCQKISDEVRVEIKNRPNLVLYSEWVGMSEKAPTR